MDIKVKGVSPTLVNAISKSHPSTQRYQWFLLWKLGVLKWYVLPKPCHQSMHHHVLPNQVITVWKETWSSNPTNALGRNIRSSSSSPTAFSLAHPKLRRWSVSWRMPFRILGKGKTAQMAKGWKSPIPSYFILTEWHLRRLSNVSTCPNIVPIPDSFSDPSLAHPSALEASAGPWQGRGNPARAVRAVWCREDWNVPDW